MPPTDRTRTLPRTLTCALAALSVVASSLLAVALAVAVPDPTPVSAQTNTNELRILEASNISDNTSNYHLDHVADSGVTYTLEPVAGSCDSGVTEPASQTQANGVDDNNSSKGAVHTLDKRCNWKATFTQTTGNSCAVSVRSLRIFSSGGLSVPAATFTNGVITLTKGSNSFMVSSLPVNALKVEVVRGAMGANNCTNTQLALDVAGSNDSPADAMLDYTLTPSGCRSDITAPAAETATDGDESTTANKVITHDLDWLCDWTISSFDANNCPNDLALFNDSTALTGEAATATGIVKLFKNPDRTKHTNPVYKLSQDATTSTPVTRIELSASTADSTKGECFAEVEVRAINSVSTVEESQVEYTFTAFDCDAGATLTATQTRADAEVTGIRNNHLFDARCNWRVEFTSTNQNFARCTRVAISKEQATPDNPTAQPDQIDTAADRLILYKDPANSHLVYPTESLGVASKQIDLLLLDPENKASGANTRRCASPLLLRNTEGELAADLKIDFAPALNSLVTPPKSIEACPNVNGATKIKAFESLAAGAERYFSLSRQCNWEVTFSSANPQCVATARLTNTMDNNQGIVGVEVPNLENPTVRRHDKDIAHVLATKPGGSVTISLTGGADHLQFTPDGDFTDKENITGIVFAGCGFPTRTAKVSLVDGTLGVPYSYSMVPVSCTGVGLPPVQTSADAVVDGTSKNHYLSFFCDWQVRFDTSNNCEVSATVGQTADTDGTVDLEGVASTPDHPGRFRYSGAVRLVTTIEVATDGAAGKCESSIELANTSGAEVGRAVWVEFKPVQTADPTMTCTPNTRVAVPPEVLSSSLGMTDDPAVMVRAIRLEGGESQTVKLSDDCTWQLEFDGVNTDCSFTVSPQQGDASNTAIVPATTAGFGDTKATVTLAGGGSGLTTGTTPTAVGRIAIDGCVAGAAPANTAKVTVIDTTPLYGLSYQLASSACTGGATNNTQLNETHAIANVDTSTGNVEYVQYLDLRCDWTYYAATSEICPVAFKVEDANGNEWVSVPADTTPSQLLTKGASQFRLGSDAAKPIAVLRATVMASDTNCVFGVEFVNRSKPKPYAVGGLEALQAALPTPRGTSGTPSDELPDLDYPFPKIALRLTPINDDGTACTATARGPQPPGVFTLDALAVVRDANNIPVLDAEGNPSFVPGATSETSYQLGDNCDWGVEFVSQTEHSPADWDDNDPACFSRAQVLDRNGEPLGNPVGGLPDGGTLITPRNAQGDQDATGTDFGPFGGGAFVLESGTAGLEYAGELVGSVEFLGCLADDLAGTAEFQVHNGGGAGADGGVTGLTYTIAPAQVERSVTEAERAAGMAVAYKTTCDGFEPPAAQTQADGTWFAPAPDALTHWLNYRCDWDVTFTGTPECAAISVWGFDETGRVFLDSVQTLPLSIRLTQAPSNTGLGNQPVVENWNEADNDFEAANLGAGQRLNLPESYTPEDEDLGALPRGGFVYYVGSGGGMRLASEALSEAGYPRVPAGSVDEDPQAVAVASLECVAAVELRNISGLEGPGLDVSIAPPARERDEDGNVPPYDPSLQCVEQERSNGTSLAGDVDRLHGIDELQPSESFTVLLPVKCGWEITFGSLHASCVVSARVLSNAYPPAPLGSVVRSQPSGFGVIELAQSAMESVGALEFYNCFTPSVSVDLPEAADNTELQVVFTAAPANPGCTAQSGQTMTVVNSEVTNEQLIAAARLRQQVGTRVKDDTSPALLAGLADDGTLCTYKVRATGPASLGALAATSAVSAAQSYVTIESESGREVSLTLRNIGAVRGRDIQVSITPQQGCLTAQPAGSPFTLLTTGHRSGSSAVVNLGAHSCVWTVSYHEVNNSCEVLAQLKDADGAVVGSADRDGFLEVTTRPRTVSSTPIAAIDFNAVNCFEPFEASFTATITDAQNGSHAGAVIGVQVVAVANSHPGCSASQPASNPTSQTVRLVVGAGNTATATKALADVPSDAAGEPPPGATANCAYTATFPETVVTSDRVLLTRTSPSASVSLSAAAPSHTATYTASLPAMVDLVNLTPSNSSRAVGSQSTVVAPLASESGCDERRALSSSPQQVTAGATNTAVLGALECAWTIGFANPADDCDVSAQLKESDGTDIGTADTDGELTVYVDDSRQVMSAASGGSQVGSIEFMVSETTCPVAPSTFDATLTVSVSTGESGIHDGALVEAVINRADNSHDDCTATRTVELVVNALNKAEAEVPGLADLPHGETTRCTYTVTFPARAHAYRKTAIDLTAPTTPATLSAASPSVAATYASASTAQLRISPSPARAFPFGLGFTWDIESDDCDQGVTAADQDEGDAHVGHADFRAVNLFHDLDYRCDWTITVTYDGTCGSTHGIGSVSPNKNHAGAYPYRLEKDTTNKRHRYDDSDDGLVLADRLTIGKNDTRPGECFKELIVADKNNMSRLDSLEGQDVTYTLTHPSFCDGLFTMPTNNVKNRPANPENNTFNYRHELDYRCDWAVEFTAPAVANKCFAVDIGYLAEGATEATIYATRGSSFSLNKNFETLALPTPDQLPDIPGISRVVDALNHPSHFLALGNKLVTESGGFRELRNAPSDRAFGDGQVVWGDPALNQPVNRLLVSYVDETANGVNQCSSEVEFRNVAASKAAVNVSVAAEALRATKTDPVEACTLNDTSDTLDEANALVGSLAAGASETLGLGRNCEWVITFGSAHPDCAVAVALRDEMGAVITIDIPTAPGEATATTKAYYTLQANPGETASLRLTGSADKLQVSVRQNGQNVSHEVSAIEFNSCQAPSDTTEIELVSKSPGVAIAYQFVPKNCASAGAVTQTNADALVTAQTTHHQLSFWCDWDVSFTAPNNCEVALVLHYRERTGILTDPVSGARDLPLPAGTDSKVDSFELFSTRTSNSPAQRDSLLHFAHSPTGAPSTLSFVYTLRKLEYSLSEDTSKCTHPIVLRNISTDVGLGEALGETEIRFETLALCFANRAGSPSPNQHGVPFVDNFMAGKTINVALATNCGWELEFFAQEQLLCAPAAEVKGVDGTTIALVQGNPEGRRNQLNLLMSEAGLTYTPTGGSATVVGSIDFDACADRARLDKATALTVVNAAQPLTVNHSFGQTACAGGSHSNANNQDQDNSVVVDGQLVNYLDYNCTWEFTVATVPATGVCKLDVEIKESADAATTLATLTNIADETTNTNAARTLTQDPMGKRLLYGAGTSTGVGALVIKPGDDCVLPVDFVNVSTPLPFSTEGDRADLDLPTGRGTQANPLTGKENVVEFDRPYPQVVLNVTPHDDGASCTPGTGSYMVDNTNRQLVVVDAGAVSTRHGREVLSYDPGRQPLKLGETCDWQVEFHPGVNVDLESDEAAPGLVCVYNDGVAANADRAALLASRAYVSTDCDNDLGGVACFAAAQVRGLAGEPLGNPVAGSPLLGGVLNLEAGAAGLTYQGSRVGSVELDGCVPAEHPGTAVFQVFDDSGMPGDFTYEIAPVVDGGVAACEGATPAAQTKADGMVFVGVPGVYQHLLSVSCDWEVTFTGVGECEAAAVWSFEGGEPGMDGELTYVDSVLANPAVPGEVSLRLGQAARVREVVERPDDDDFPADEPTTTTDPNDIDERQAAIEDWEAERLLGPSFVYFRGSSAQPADALPVGAQPEGDASGGLRSGPGYEVDLNAPAGPGAMARVNAVSLECASVVEVTHFAGLQGPALEFSVRTPPVEASTQPVRSMNPVFETSVTDCVATQDRPPLSRLESGEAFRLALDRDCNWNVEFRSVSQACLAAAQVFSDEATPTLLHTQLQQTVGQLEPVTLKAAADGVKLMLASGSVSAESVGAIEFYNCFYPSVPLEVHLASSVSPAVTELRLDFAPVGSQPGCTTTASQTVVLGSGERVELSNERKTTLAEYFANHNKLKGSAALLKPLATDGSLCRYSVSVPASSGMGLVRGGDAVLTAEAGYARLLARPLVGLTLENVTTGASLTTKHNVKVTLVPGVGCASPVPAGSPFTLTPAGTETAQLGPEACDWTVEYENGDGECTVSAQPKSGGSATGLEADSDGSLVLRTQPAAEDLGATAKLVDEVEFTVSDTCYTVFDATFTVEVSDARSGDYVGQRFSVTVAPVASSHATCSERTGTFALVTGAKVVGQNQLATAVRKLPDVPTGETDMCEYDVTFNDASVTTSGGVVLYLSGSATAQVSNASNATRSVSRTYARAPEVEFVNVTQDGRAAHTRDGMAHVWVRVEKAGDCSATVPSGVEVARTLDTAAGKSVTAGLGAPDCGWNIRFRNATSDCEASAQLLKADTNNDPSDDAVGADVVTTDAGGGRFSLVVFEGRVYRYVGGNPGNRSTEEVVKVEFTVSDSKCVSYFDGVVELTVKDTAAATHAGSVMVELAPKLAFSALDHNCSQPPQGSAIAVPVDLSMTATTRAGVVYTGTAKHLIDDDPFDALNRVADCEYEVTFPASPAVGGVSFKLVGADTTLTDTVSDSSKVVERTYDAVRPAALTLMNETATDTEHDPITRRGVKVTPQSGGCATTQSDGTALAAGTALELDTGSSKSKDVTLGSADCMWTVKVTNPEDDCQVRARMWNPAGMRVGRTIVDSTTLVLHVYNHRVYTEANGGGFEVGSVGFAVRPRCVTLIDPTTISITTTDPNNASNDHTGTMVTVQVTPDEEAPAGCTESASAVITLDASGAGSATVSPKLVDWPLRTNSACVYAAEFPLGQASNASGVRLNRADSTDAKVYFDSNASGGMTGTASVSGAYVAVSAAGVTLKNTTLSNSGHELTEMRQVQVTVTPVTGGGSSCTATAPSGSPFTIDPEGQQEVSLGSQECDWMVSFQTPATNSGAACTITARLLSGNTEVARQTGLVAGGSVTLHVEASLDTISGASSASGGMEFDTIEFSSNPYGTGCDVVLRAELSVDVTDVDSGNHEDSEIEVTITKVTDSHARCSAPDPVTLTLDANNEASDTVYLVDGPHGMLNMRCSYTVLFPGLVDSELSGVKLRLTGALTSIVNSGFKVVPKRTYRAERPARVTLVNTTDTGSGHQFTTQRGVSLTPSGSCVASRQAPSGTGTVAVPNGTAFALPATSGSNSREVFLGTDDCNWTLSVGNADSDCDVEVLLKRPDTNSDPSDDAIGSAAVSGSLTLNVTNSQTRNSAGMAVEAVEFEVSETCTTYFKGQVTLTVTDTEAATHAGEISVGLARADATRSDCSATPTSVSVDLSAKAATPPGFEFDGETDRYLVGDPLGVAGACSYVLTFPVNPTVGGIGFELAGSDTTTTATISESSKVATRTYDVKRDAKVLLANATSTGSAHSPTTRRVVKVTPQTAGTCAAETAAGTAIAAGSDIDLDAGSSNTEVVVSLGQTACRWTIDFANTAGDCGVSAQLYHINGGDIGSADTSGSLTLYVAANRRVMSAASGGMEVGSVVFTVSDTCVTFIGPVTVALTTDDDDNATNDHSNTTITVTVSPKDSTQHAGCTQSASAAVMLNASGSGSATIMPDLVNVPLGTSSSCEYTATFPPRQASMASGIQLNRTSGATLPITSSTTSLAGAYEAVESAGVTLRNVTLGTSDHVLAAMRQVRVTVTPVTGAGTGCSETAPSASPYTLAASGEVSVSLGTGECDWTIGFVNPEVDSGAACTVTARLLGGAGGRSVVSTETGMLAGGSVTVHVDANLATQSGAKSGSGAMAVSAIAFTVNPYSSACDTVFDAELSVAVTDPDSGNHATTDIEVTISRASGPQTGCSAERKATLTLGAGGSVNNAAAATVNLVDRPLGASGANANCVYSVAFPGSVNSELGGVQLKTSDTAATASAAAKTVPQRTYTAVRPARVQLVNATSAHAAAASRSVVSLTPLGSCAASGLTAGEAFTLPAAAGSNTRTVFLGTEVCNWTLRFANQDVDCTVTAQRKAAGSAVGAPVTNVDGSLTLNVAVSPAPALVGGVDTVEFAVTDDCDASFGGTLSVSASDTLDADISNRNHTGTELRVSVTAASGGSCTASQMVTLTLGAGNAASGSVTGLVAKKAGQVACSYNVGFPSSVNSATNPKVLLVRTAAVPAQLSASSRTSTAAYVAEEIPDPPPPALVVSVGSAGSVAEGETLVFPVSMPGVASQPVTVNYVVSPASATTASSGSVMIAAGQSATTISVPTADDDLDEANQTVTVTLTGVTGGAQLNSLGRSATGVVRDDDPSPQLGLAGVVIDGNRLRFTLVLSAVSGRDVRARYTSPAGSGTAVVPAGQREAEASQVFDRQLLASGGQLSLRLVSAQNASLDVNARERVVTVGGSWQFHTVSRASGVRASQLAQTLELGASWRLFAWNAAGQRWVESSPAVNPNALLVAGVTITWRGTEAAPANLEAAGIGQPASITLRQGWNIFTPDPAAVGRTRSDFTRTQDGGTAVIFDPVLIDCDNLAGLLVIYTFDQHDPHSQNGFRLALPCHPELLDQLGIPVIETIDQNDTIYVWFNSTTPAQITYTNGQYSPAA